MARQTNINQPTLRLVNGANTTLAGLPTHQNLYLSKKKKLLLSRSTVSSVGWTYDYDARDSEFEPWPDRPTLTQLVRKCYLCWKFHRAMVTIWNLKRSFRLRALWCWSSTTSRSPHSFAKINSNSSFFCCHCMASYTRCISKTYHL